ncbi:hypothetical protein MtrunA17_Chr7g0235631 [Medicago truncatula]|uniref:Uncharacterized protein n=1 Tax=Medicago truncatula TaxID=3880 RepID=A0A396H024_MEDTR|nr:hypothetical protein MtrunA17_Chr7g0235631 [Medicago truncatula]
MGSLERNIFTSLFPIPPIPIISNFSSLSPPSLNFSLPFLHVSLPHNLSYFHRFCMFVRSKSLKLNFIVLINIF